MSTKEATPRQWRVTDEFYVSSPNGFVPIRTPFREDAFDLNEPREKWAEAEANAELIVTAVNSHDALVALARAVVSMDIRSYPSREALAALHDEARQCLKLVNP